MRWDGEVCAETATWTRRARRPGPASRRPPTPTGLTSEERARRPGPREPKAAGADWTDERGTSEEGRRRLKGGRRRAGETQHTAGPSAGSPPGRGQRCEVTGRARGPGGPL